MDLGGVDLAWCSRHDLRDSPWVIRYQRTARCSSCEQAPGSPVVHRQPRSGCATRNERFPLGAGLLGERGWLSDCQVLLSGRHLSQRRAIWLFYQRCQDYEIIVCIHIGASPLFHRCLSSLIRSYWTMFVPPSQTSGLWRITWAGLGTGRCRVDAEVSKPLQQH